MSVSLFRVVCDDDGVSIFVRFPPIHTYTFSGFSAVVIATSSLLLLLLVPRAVAVIIIVLVVFFALSPVVSFGLLSLQCEEEARSAACKQGGSIRLLAVCDRDQVRARSSSGSIERRV